MHYIRFLKSPKVIKGHKVNDKATVDAKITITTDLGESFLAIDTVVLVYLAYTRSNRIFSGKAKSYTWKGKTGMRSLEVSIPISINRDGEENGPIQMVISSKERNFKVEHLGDDVKGMHEEGGIFSVRSIQFEVTGNRNRASGMEERVLQIRSDAQLRIWEETGHSIARHIWDAGLVLSSYLTSQFGPNHNCQQSGNQMSIARPPFLGHTLSQTGLNILELGAGCGIVGITLAHMIGSSTSQILLTDLEEASEILSHNISTSTLATSTNISQQILDWSQPLPSNVQATKWDLVIASDCTYNPDVVPDLVSTLKSLAKINKNVVVLLAMKVRHDSELVFFELMDGTGFTVKEKIAVPLPVLGGVDEEIDILIFRRKA